MGIEARRQASTSEQTGDGRWWRTLWSLHIPSKVKIFIWRVWHNILPVQTSLQRRGIVTPTLCTRCNEEPENLLHALLHCPAAMEVWMQSVFGKQHMNWKSVSFVELLLELMNSLSRGDLEIFCMVLCMV